MGFEYRELTTQVFFGQEEKSPPHCRAHTQDVDPGCEMCDTTKPVDDEDDRLSCNQCSTTKRHDIQPPCNQCSTTKQHGIEDGMLNPRELALLRQQLRDVLAAG